MNDDEVRHLLAQLEADIERIVAEPPTPMPDLWPCNKCGHTAVCNLGNEGYCSAHLTALYATFSPEAWVDGGVGLQDGPARPEYGPLEYDLRCCCCGATWTGIPGDLCWWCQRSREIQIDHQIDLLLTPPDVDPDDITFEKRMGAWADRLVVGEKAGLITQAQADTAWHRATNHRSEAS